MFSHKNKLITNYKKMNMKKIFFSLLFILISIFTFGQTAGIQGSVFSSENKPLEGVTVSVYGTNYSTTTDKDGKFIIQSLIPGEYQLLLVAQGFDNVFINNIKVENDKITDIGKKTMKLMSVNVEDEGVVEINADDLNNEQGEENISTLLHGSRDAFLNAAAYALGPMRFKIRGYDNRYTQVMINGLDMANLETGSTYWSNWGGLNDVTRYKNTIFGLNAADATFGDIGGSTNIQMIPSTFRKGFKLTYSLANRSYRDRAMITYSTGLLPSNWAFTVSASRRWANEGYVAGTFYDAWGYYLGVEKKLRAHDIVFNVFGAPTRRGKQGASTQEAYDLLNNVYYNPYWGYQNGVKRNSRVAIAHQPVAILSDLWKIDMNTSLNTTVAVRAGKNGATALNWYNAPDPRPDYYRYLPSYITSPQEAQIVADSFVSPNYSQINWADLYDANRNSFDVVQNADGIAGNTVSGKRAQYIVEERRYDQVFAALASNLSKQLTDNLKLDGGFQYRYFVGKNFKVLDDLLGADYWLDIDKYAERDIANPDSSQSDLNHPNNIIKVGDKFGYNYNSNIRDAKLWAQGVLDIRKFNIFLAAYSSYTTMWREGLMRNGKFPDNSYGNSKKLDFLDYGAKTGVVFKVNGRNFIQGHAAYLTQAPTFRNVYVSPRTRDNTIANPVSEKIMSADIGYSLRAPRIKASLRFFYTEFKDQSKIMSFYHDGYRNFVNYAISGINKTHQGIEMALSGNISSTLSAYAVASLGYYRWTSRPTVTVTIDNSAQVLDQGRTVYAMNFLVAGTPQTAASVGFNYKAPKYWYFGMNANYVDDIFLDFNPERRTADAVEGVIPDSQLWNNIVNQEKLPSGYTLDASVGKSYRFHHKYFLNINLSLNNILNNTKIITGGYEQLRYDVADKDPYKYPAKYYYLYGRQFFLNVSLSF